MFDSGLSVFIKELLLLLLLLLLRFKYCSWHKENNLKSKLRIIFRKPRGSACGSVGMLCCVIAYRKRKKYRTTSWLQKIQWL